MEYPPIVTPLSRPGPRPPPPGAPVRRQGRKRPGRSQSKCSGGHRRCAAPGADVRHHLAGPGVGADEILAQGNRLLRGVDGVCHRGERQHISRKPPPVRLAAGTLKLPIVGAVAALTVDFLVRLPLLKLRIVQGGLPIEHQNILRFFQRSAAGVEKAGASALVPHPFIAEHGEVGRAQHLIIGALGEQQHRPLRLHRPPHRLPQLRQGQRHIPVIPGRAVGRIGQEHINRVPGQGAQPLDAVHEKQAVRGQGPPVRGKALATLARSKNFLHKSPSFRQ